MVNMLKAELLRMRKSRSFWATLLVFIALFALCVIVQAKSQSSSNFEISQETTKIGLYIAVDSYLLSLNSLVIAFGSTFGMLTFGIFLSGFVGQEYSSGYIKNTSTMPNGRINLLLTKIVLAGMLSVFILLLSYGLGIVLGTFLIPHFQLDDVSAILQTFFYSWLLTTASFSFTICLTTLFKNKVAGIIMLFLVASGLCLPLIGGILDLVHLNDLVEYTLSYQYATIMLADPNETYINSIIVSLSAIGFYTIISLIILKNRDF